MVPQTTIAAGSCLASTWLFLSGESYSTETHGNVLPFVYNAQLEPNLSRLLYAGFVLHSEDEGTLQAH